MDGRLGAERGVEVREWKVQKDTGRLDLADLDRLLDSKVRVVCFPHASNIVGEINPVHDIAMKARSYGAITVVDGVSYAPHGLPDLLELGCEQALVPVATGVGQGPPAGPGELHPVDQSRGLAVQQVLLDGVTVEREPPCDGRGVDHPLDADGMQHEQLGG